MRKGGEELRTPVRIERPENGHVDLLDGSAGVEAGEVQDITEAKRAEALSRAQNRILELIAKGTPLPDVLQEICHFIEGQALGTLSAVMILNEAGTHLTLGAAPSLPTSFSRAMDPIAVGPCAGSCGRAAYSGKRVISSDINTDPLWVDYRDWVVSNYGLRACWSTPIFSAGGQVMGTLDMYHREPCTPGPREFELIERSCHVAAIAIESSQAQKVSTALMVKAKEVEVLQKMDRMRKELIATVAHEIRNPLASIKGYISTLLQSDVKWEPELQHEFLSIANQEADRLNRLVGDLLTISQEEAGVLTLDRELLDVGSLLNDVEVHLGPLVSRHALHVTVHGRMPQVSADRNRVFQVIGNLVGNAAKYSSAGSRICIDAAADDTQVVIQVQDEGDGIPAEPLERIFEPFYRMDGGSPSTGSGFGLGLSICRSLIKAHGGRIWAESEVGKGSTFCFSLPAAGVDT